MSLPRGWGALATLLAATSLLPAAHALEPNRRLTQYPIHVWYAEDGLPSNAILSVLQTRDGYIWAGAEEGLARFDGARFTSYDRRAAPGLASGNCWTLLPDGRRGLLVGMRGCGLCVFADGACVKSFHAGDGLPGDQVMALCRDRSGRAWVGTRDGLVTLEGDALVPAPFQGQLPAPGVAALLEDARGVLWVGGSKGLSRWDGRSLTVLGEADGLPSANVRALALEGDGSVLVGTTSGLARVHDGSDAPVPFPDGFVPQVRSLLVDRHGVVWIGRESGGILRLRGTRLDGLGAREGLPGATVYGMVEDHEGSLWLATVMGLARLRDSRLTAFTRRGGLVSDFVQSIAEGDDGALYVSGGEPGISRIDGEQLTVLGRSEGLPEKQAYSLLSDGRALWVGTNGGGLARLEAGVVTRVLTTRDGLPSDQVRVLAHARGGGVWVGETGGPERVRGGRVEPLAEPAGGVLISAIVEDADGTLWIGTDGSGLHGRRPDGSRFGLDVSGGLGSSRVSVLHRDGGSLWIATHGGGLHRLRQGKLSRLGLAEGLFDDNIFQIVADGTAFLVMELLGGLDLSRVVRRHGPGTPAQVAEVARQAGSALAAAHAGGVIHRDIKPANLFLVPSSPGFEVKVLDFGLARTPASDADLTRSGMVVGTPAYVAPELLRGRPADERSDLYAFAAVLFEALTGRKLVPGSDLAEIWLGVLTVEPPRPSPLVPGLTSAVDGLLLTGLAKVPASRASDVGAWSAALADALDGCTAGPGSGWPAAVAPAPGDDGDDLSPLEVTRPMAG